METIVNFSECGDCMKSREHSKEEYDKLIHRLNRIEGQIRGIRGMLEKNAPCPDIIVQTSAVNAALNSFNRELLSGYIRTCVSCGMLRGNDEAVEKLMTALQKTMK
ncbi:metal-sensing transcriptional repressor [Candidatus Methanomethylophilus sp. 1R26]|uniref:metal-sensing transcriptional repressor n=1 Tax=Candidatus Methanomethylophilus sp. 1R26 TaxID=1769296 RepID=UPI000AEB6318|nr:metal-sensing transcriptional repressor [Candidatus Methanomethylophilus sp. 1R26]